MSGPEYPSPAQDPEVSPSRGTPPNVPDPLLDSGSFIDPDLPKSEEAADNPNSDEPENVEFAPGVVIAAQPISMFHPDSEDSAEAAQRTNKRKDMSEMSKRPSWLPPEWKIDLKTRATGASAGFIDRYYIDPTGKYKFRSRIEVLHFLETGEKAKKRTGAAGSPVARNQNKSSSNSKKSEAKSDSTPNSKRKKTKDADSEKRTPGK